MGIWAISDLHGRYDLWTKACQEFFCSTDTIYFLGDACDRGPDGYKLIIELMNDSRVRYIKGNHEDMFEKAARDILKGDDHFCVSQNLDLHLRNGGAATLEVWDRQDHRATKFINKISKLPYQMKYKNKYGLTCILNHSGTLALKPLPHDYLWDRDIKDYDIWNRGSGEYIIHGHTPVQRARADNKFEPYKYHCGHRIDIDGGSAWSNKLIIFNLDTFEHHIIEV